jgi:hypothetical protein
MLELVKKSVRAADLLAGYFEFDLERDEPVEDLRLASGAALEPIAGEGAGGCYLLSGTGDSRPVLFATSEGQGGLIAASLTEALQLIIRLPYWGDCLKFSAGGSLDEMRRAAQRLEQDLQEDYPSIEQERDQLRADLSLPDVSVDDALRKLQRAVAGTEPDFVLLDPNGLGYGSLFGTFRVADNPAWR